MLVTLTEILNEAEKEKYAVGLFNHLNLEMARGIAEAAEEERSPVILGVAEVHLPVIPFDYAAVIMKEIAEKATVPVCLHFDHGTEYGKILRAMQAGFSSVMYDGSALTYEENVRCTREISHAAHALNISVEAELGHVGSGDDIDCDDHTGMYTDPEVVNDFIRRTDIDALAVAIGTAHGVYKAKPRLDIDRLKKIYELSEKPLVLHGGSGLSDEDFRATIDNGIRKINICTELCGALYDSYQNSYHKGYSFEKMLTAAKDSVKETVKSKMRLFGSSGKA